MLCYHRPEMFESVCACESVCRMLCYHRPEMFESVYACVLASDGIKTWW